MSDNKQKLVCAECGGDNIEHKCWVDVNSDLVLDNCSDVDIEDNWCRDCEMHVNFKMIENEDL